MILDTAFVLDVLDGESRAVETLEDLETRRVQQKVPSTTVFELHHGVVRADEPESGREEIVGVLESKPIVPADGDVMAKAGRIHGRLQNAGLSIGESDCIIGASALLQDEPVVTRNVDHFERIDDVDVRPY